MICSPSMVSRKSACLKKRNLRRDSPDPVSAPFPPRSEAILTGPSRASMICSEGECGLDHGIGHFMLVEADSEAQVAVPPIPKSPQTSSAASDRKIAPQPSSHQAV